MSKRGAVSRRHFMGLCGALTAQTILSGRAKAEAVSGPLKAGIARVDITPEPGIDIAGSMARQVVRDIHDPLYVRSLVLDNGATQIALVLVDSCMLGKESCDIAKAWIQAGSPLTPERVCIAATHTHSAPCAAPVFQNTPDRDYIAFLEARIAECVLQAYEALEPVEAAWGAGSLPDEVFNRRWLMEPEGIAPDPWGETNDRVRMNPPRQSPHLIEQAGPTDPEIPFLAVRRADGSPLAVFANYALHYVGGIPGETVSADYFGVFADRLEALLGADEERPVLAMLCNGASGDINNIDFTAPAPSHAAYEKMGIVGEKVAGEVHAAWQELRFTSDLALDAVSTTLTLGIRRPDTEALAEAQQIVDVAEIGDGVRSLQEIYAWESVQLASYPEDVPVPLQALRIGGLVIATTPCEVFVETGLALKAAASLDYCMPIGLANGYNGYLPTREQHVLGGYETWRARSSCLEIDAEEKIREALERMLQRLA